jgi:hypothetical protein
MTRQNYGNTRDPKKKGNILVKVALKKDKKDIYIYIYI